MFVEPPLFVYSMSPSTRRAWIEILPELTNSVISSVALHPEGVDRNTTKKCWFAYRVIVALHPEGVDRNLNKMLEELEKMRRPPPGGRG